MRLATALAAIITLAPPAHVPAQAQTLPIGNKGEDTVSFVDLRSGNECARIATGRAPHEIAVSPDGRQAAVVSYGGTTIDIFDVAGSRRIRSIDLAPNAAPHGVAWLRGGHIIATTEGSRTLSVVDLRGGTVSSVATDQQGSHMLAVSPDQHTAYVANIMSGTVSIIDLVTMKKTGDIAVGGHPEGLAITKDGKQLWVGDNGVAHVRIVDLATQKTIAALPTDSVAFRVAISPDGKTAVTSNLASGTLNLFDVATRKPVGTISVSGDPKATQVTLAFAPGGKRVYVAETMKDTIAEVDLASARVTRRITAGKNGDGLGLSPQRCRLPR